MDFAEPAQRLAPNARWVWRLHWVGGCVVALLIGMAVRRELDGTLAALAWALPAGALVLGTVVVPELRWRRWRWEVREHEIDLRRGLLVLRRTLIPMTRVQHVETERGVLDQAFDLATVEIHTAAGGHKIPMLTEHDAGMLRARIAELARTADG